MRVVHEETKLLEITLPYIPGFLAFRESPPLLDMLATLVQILKSSVYICFYAVHTLGH
jgi:deoxyinosine 3'endonuclease (endonuclease V)